MRCPECKRTGFTEEELLAHENKFGHKILRTPSGAVHPTSATDREFPQTESHRLSKTELLDAMAAMLTPDDLKTWLTALVNKAADPPPDGAPP